MHDDVNNINKPREPKVILDPNDWWKKIVKKQVEKIINNHTSWKYYLVDNWWVTTIEDWDVKHYEAREVEIKDSEKVEIPQTVKDSTESSTLEILESFNLNATNKVSCVQEGKERARTSISDNPVFWFVAKTNKPTICVMDFSNDDINHPEIKSYPVDETIIEKIENRTITI